MTAPRLTGISILERRPMIAGCTIVATFDCLVGGLELAGCSLAIATDGRIIVWAPPPGKRGSAVSRVRFIDLDLRSEITDAALAGFESLGGVLPEGAFR